MNRLQKTIISAHIYFYLPDQPVILIRVLMSLSAHKVKTKRRQNGFIDHTKPLWLRHSHGAL